MKKLINSTDTVLPDMLAGMVVAHPTYMKKLDDFNVLVRTTPATEKVVLVSGGGSGHEPAHAGYIGKGMLDAAIAGEVFTSPTPDQIYEGIKAVDNGSGVLLVVKNYAGDIMNFEMAKELAEMEGIEIETVIVNDDVAVEDSTYTTGRRGVAGTLFVHKIAGAKAERGASLQEVKVVAEKVVANVRTMGIGLSSCIVPAAGKANFELGEEEIEIGMGIHGEPGIFRKKMAASDEISDELLDKILGDMNLTSGDEMAVIINGLSGTPLMELYIVNKRVHERLTEKGIFVSHTFVGEYMTSLEMAGCSISVLKLDAELKELLEDAADTPAFKTIKS